ncbi:MAG TPA: hypothetical protein VFE15_10890 [Marmoricola sp.]|jgi:hypothetical protein|nr:hypothetical protein [Marmoricola sp.]
MTISPTTYLTAAVPRRNFADFSVARQVWEGVGCAALAGSVTGVALGTSAWLYLATAALATIAGIPAATQHRTLRGALVRTSVGGFVWAGAVLMVYALCGQTAAFPVLQPQWYLVSTTLPAMAVGWLVWTWAQHASPEISRG